MNKLEFISFPKYKLCKICKQTKLRTKFYFSYHHRDERRPSCKACYNKRSNIHIKKYYKKLFKLQPWCKALRSIHSRCLGRKHPYHKKGIKNFLTRESIKYLWFRDKAYLLERPSIDRLDTKGNYTLENCRYIELRDNQVEGGRNSRKYYNIGKEA